MDLPQSSMGQKYKVKLSTGRVLGPLDLDRIRLFISKNQIVGKEEAHEDPHGEWKNINLFPEIAELLVAHAAGANVDRQEESEQKSDPYGATSVIENLGVLPGADNQLPGTQVLAPLQGLQTLTELKLEDSPPPVSELTKSETKIEDVEEKTIVGSIEENPEEEATRIVEGRPDILTEAREPLKEKNDPIEVNYLPPKPSISQEKTVVFQRSTESGKLPGKKKPEMRKILIYLIVGLGLYLNADVFFDNSPKPVVRVAPIRPKLPDFTNHSPDPNASAQIYNDAMKDYIQDTVVGYRIAAEKLRKAAAIDSNNVKALAMLASCYLNLIDSSNKDENYFSVISKLIDMSRAKAVDLTETVIADVEFYLVVNKAEAAQNRIIEFTKSHNNYGFELFYYLALTFFARGEPTLAARYLSQIPDNKVFSAKIFYLKGQVAEKLRDNEAALLEYKKGIRFNSKHARSQLKLAALLNKQGSIKETEPHLEFLMKNPQLLSPSDLGKAYFLHAQLCELNQKWDLALGDVERATKLDPENHDYLLELYTLRARSGESLKTAQQQARMYYFLGEGEKLIQQGKYQDALVQFLQARQANDTSPIPLVKIGDMFTYLHDTENAKRNYKVAAERAKDNIQIWSKYIQSLIQSFEWEEATKAMDRFRKMPVSQSAIDKAAADLNQKQGRFQEAQMLYKKAMARDVIDPDVYIAYAKSLMSTKNFKDAPFFFALALRFDPLNVDAIINTAKCVAETESIDRAISMLQDELKISNTSRAEYLSGIAELQIQKGDWGQAQLNIEQAMKANPDYSYPWKLQGQIYLNREGQDRDALDKALLAYKSYLERNVSDPTGYLERYKIFIKKSEFENAKEELAKIYEIYPKYPNLHFYFGKLYSIQGNHVAARDEFRAELANNPNNLETLISYGKELMELNRAEDALVVFTKAMQVAPLSSDAKQNAGWANYKLKHFPPAVALLQAALATDKANPLIFKRLGIVYRDMGDMGSACGAFRKYLEMEPDAPDKGEFQVCL